MICKNEKYPASNDTALCGSDILNEYISSRVIRSKFLMDKDAFSSEISNRCQTTEDNRDDNIESDVNVGTDKIGSSKIGADTGSAYPVPPPIKRIEQPNLVINIKMQK